MAIAILDFIGRITEKLIPWGGLAFIFYMIFRMVEVIAGKQTDFNLIVSLFIKRWTPFFGHPGSLIKVDSLWLICCPVLLFPGFSEVSFPTWLEGRFAG